MAIAELAARIDVHMRRGLGVGARATYDPDRIVFGGPSPVVDRVVLKYAFGIAEHDLDATTAERYLDWLDAGHVGRHWEMKQKKPPALAEGEEDEMKCELTVDHCVALIRYHARTQLPVGHPDRAGRGRSDVRRAEREALEAIEWLRVRGMNEQGVPFDDAEYGLGYMQGRGAL